MKDRAGEFNDIINEVLNSERGMSEFNFGNTRTTIAYEPVIGPGINRDPQFTNSIGTLIITIPHTLADDVALLIDNQQITNFLIIILILAVAGIIAIILLKWNNTLQGVVKQKTTQLKETADKLRKTNEYLTLQDKAQKEFINIAAHELRTPSKAIGGNLELIEMTCLPSLFARSEEQKQDSFDKEFDELAKDNNKRRQFKDSLVSTY